MKRTLALGVVLGLASCSSNPKVATSPAPVAGTISSTLPSTPPSSTRTASTIFQPSRLVAGRDSFVAVAGGQPIGGTTLALSREGGNYRYVVDIGLTAVNVRQHYESLFDASTLMPSVQTMTGNIQGMAMTTHITIADGRARGTAQEPGPAGITTTNVDLAVPAGTVDDQSSAALVETLDLTEGFKVSFKSLSAPPGELRMNELTVQARETVTVPAGTFETYRVLVHSKDDAVIFITTALPHRVVLVRVENGAVELRLAK